MKKFIPGLIIADINADNGVPEWVLLFKAGINEIEGEGSFLADEEAFFLVQEYVARRGNDVPWDYEHQTLTGNEAPAAGWNKKFRWDAEQGIMARVEWTAKASGYIAKKEYRFFSPVFYVRKKDNRVCALHSVALTNTPKTNNLKPILAKLETDDIYEGIFMNRKELIAKLGLKEDATDAEILTAVAKLGVKLPETKIEKKEVVAKDVIEALELKEGDTVSTVVASIHALKQVDKTAVSQAAYDALKKRLDERDADEVVAKAMQEGKITPNQKKWAIKYAENDIEGFKTFVAKAPQVVPVDGLPDSKNARTSEDDVQLKINKQMGIDEETWEKFGPEKEK